MRLQKLGWQALQVSYYYELNWRNILELIRPGVIAKLIKIFTVNFVYVSHFSALFLGQAITDFRCLAFCQKNSVFQLGPNSFYSTELVIHRYKKHERPVVLQASNCIYVCRRCVYVCKKGRSEDKARFSSIATDAFKL